MGSIYVICKLVLCVSVQGLFDVILFEELRISMILSIYIKAADYNLLKFNDDYSNFNFDHLSFDFK